MSCPNRSYPLRLAVPSDSEAIRRVLESGSYPGQIEVRFTRRPDPYRSYLNDGEALVMPVTEYPGTGEIIGVGGCVLRRAHVNGRVEQTGYLTGLKLLEEYRGRNDSFREAYSLIRRETADACKLYVTTILSENTTAIKFLEKKRKGLPPYRFIGEYTVFCMGTRGSSGPPKGLRFVRGGDGIAAFYREHLPRFNLSPVWGSLYGLGQEDFYTLRTGGGEILAACAVWNQQSYKQYTVTRYGGVYKLLEKLPTRLLGYPAVPREGNPANYASIALPLLRPDSLALGRDFLKLAASQAREYEFLMLGLLPGHPLYGAAQKTRHLQYKSRLYTVEYEGCLELDERPLMLEAGLL